MRLLLDTCTFLWIITDSPQLSTRAAELFFLAKMVDAREAERIGLVNRVVPDDRLMEEARSWAERLARGPAFGLEITKKLVVREMAMDMESALAAEVEIQAACMEHSDFREAYEAFKEKRPPKFA